MIYYVYNKHIIYIYNILYIIIQIYIQHLYQCSIYLPMPMIKLLSAPYQQCSNTKQRDSLSMNVCDSSITNGEPCSFFRMAFSRMTDSCLFYLSTACLLSCFSATQIFAGLNLARYTVPKAPFPTFLTSSKSLIFAGYDQHSINRSEINN